jgi:hypothetical protein
MRSAILLIIASLSFDIRSGLFTSAGRTVKTLLCDMEMLNCESTDYAQNGA